MVKNRFEVLNELDSGELLNACTAAGLLPVSVSANYQIYKAYLVLKNKPVKKSEAINITADKFNISKSYVYKIIGFMENK